MLSGDQGGLAQSRVYYNDIVIDVSIAEYYNDADRWFEIKAIVIS